NHTLLSLEALRSRKHQCAGVIMVGKPNAENKRAIEHYGKSKVLAEIPLLEKVSRETLLNQIQKINLETLWN
ncbi:MAG: AAA family ATPase, partial [Bacteriovorax sp.]